MKFPVRSLLASSVLSFSFAVAHAAPIYSDGQSTPLAACPTCVVGTHLAAGVNGSVAGVGGSGINAAAGSALNGQRTYTFDLGYPGFSAGDSIARGSADFACWSGTWVLRCSNALYTIRTITAAADITTLRRARCHGVSVWVATTTPTSFCFRCHAFDITRRRGKPTYKFEGTEPSFIYRGGSPESGVINAYTRDYTFGDDYRYYGVRSSLISVRAQDADPEIDAVVGNPGAINIVPEPGSLALLGFGLLALSYVRRRIR